VHGNELRVGTEEEASSPPSATTAEGTLVLATGLPGELGYRGYTEPGVRRRHRRLVEVAMTVCRHYVHNGDHG